MLYAYLYYSRHVFWSHYHYSFFQALVGALVCWRLKRWWTVGTLTVNIWRVTWNWWSSSSRKATCTWGGCVAKCYGKRSSQTQKRQITTGTPASPGSKPAFRTSNPKLSVISSRKCFSSGAPARCHPRASAVSRYGHWHDIWRNLIPWWCLLIQRW